MQLSEPVESKVTKEARLRSEHISSVKEAQTLKFNRDEPTLIGRQVSSNMEPDTRQRIIVIDDLSTALSGLSLEIESGLTSVRIGPPSRVMRDGKPFVPNTRITLITPSGENRLIDEEATSIQAYDLQIIRVTQNSNPEVGFELFFGQEVNNCIVRPLTKEPSGQQRLAKMR